MSVKQILSLGAILLWAAFFHTDTMVWAVPGPTHQEHGTAEKNSVKTHEMPGSHDHEKMVMAVQQEEPKVSQTVKIEERLGKKAAVKSRFKDENGKEIILESLFDRPVVILPVYFTCPSICSVLQANFARVLNLVDPVPGKDFNVVTLSFADDEGPHLARASKQNYMNLIQRPFDHNNWFYLTGDRENILKLTDSLGYYFIKKKKDLYIHPSTMVVLGKDAKITRYLYGPKFLPFDLGMALSEAEQGKTGVSIKRGVLSFCFDYDPQNKTYVFKLFRVTGTAILILLAGFVLFLLYGPQKKEKGS